MVRVLEPYRHQPCTQYCRACFGMAGRCCWLWRLRPARVSTRLQPFTMATGAAAALQATGMATTVHTKEEMLPWQAFYAMSYMVRMSNSVMAST